MIKTDKVLLIPMPLLIDPVPSLIYLWFITPVTPSVSNTNQKKDVVNSAVFLRMSDVSEIIRGGSGPCCCYNFSPCEPGFAAACRGTSVWRKQQTHGALMTVNKQIWINWFNLHRGVADTPATNTQPVTAGECRKSADSLILVNKPAGSL